MTYLEMAKQHNDIDRAEKTALSIIWEALKNGDQFGTFDYWNYHDNKPMFYPSFWRELYVFIGYGGKKYIGWRNYGESATGYNKRDLKWIIETIFNTSAVDFLKDKLSYYQFKETATEENIKHMIEEKATERGFIGNVYDYIAPDAFKYF